MPPYYCYDGKDTKIITYPGRPYPLGANYDGHGINFALYSEFATKVYLCLFHRKEHDESIFVEFARISITG